MSKKKRQAVVWVFCTLAVLIIIAVIIIGCNIVKNRWHKIDFNIDTITAEKISYEDSSDDGYYVTVKGTAKAWFYDFNSYMFDLTPVLSAENIPESAQNSNILSVNNREEASFTISFVAPEIENISNYIYRGENILVNGERKEATDIRLFIGEYTDDIIIE